MLILVSWWVGGSQVPSPGLGFCKQCAWGSVGEGGLYWGGALTHIPIGTSLLVLQLASAGGVNSEVHGPILFLH